MLLMLPILVAALSNATPLSQPWRDIAPGVQSASAAELGGDPSWSARVVLIDPAHASFLVRYDPARPTLSEWRRKYPSALAISNGSFYSVDGPPGAEVRPTCDMVAEGKPVRGAGCHRQDALFFGASPRQEILASTRPPVSREPPRTQPQARILPPADFRPEQWIEALKSFPALVR